MMRPSALDEKEEKHLSSPPPPSALTPAAEQSPSSHSNLEFQGFYFTQMPPCWPCELLTD